MTQARKVTRAPAKDGGAIAKPRMLPVRGEAEVEVAPDERLVDRVVSQLRRLIVHGQVDMMVRVGTILIHEFYGSEEAARSRNSIKPASLARLAERADEFGMSAANLRFVVPLTLAVREIGLPLSTRLGVSRVRALLPIKDTTQRKLLAETAVASDLSVDKLEAKVRQIQRPHAGGRPEKPVLDRTVERLARILGDVGPADLRKGLEDISPARARKILAQVNRIQADIERIEKLAQRIATRETPSTE